MRCNATRIITMLALLAPVPGVPGDALPSWLEGCWQRTGADTLTVERWLPPSANALLGASETRRDGVTVAWEFLQIVTSAQGTRYVAWPSGQQPTDFPRVGGAAGEWVFENPGHDFPQRIVYPEPADGRLEVRIEGEIDGEHRVVHFPMQRVACADAWKRATEVEGASQSG